MSELRSDSDPFYMFAFLCDNLVVRGETSTGFCPSDLGRRISGGMAVELQTLALLDISYRWLDGDHWGDMVRCKKTQTDRPHQETYLQEIRSDLLNLMTLQEMLMGCSSKKHILATYKRSPPQKNQYQFKCTLYSEYFQSFTFLSDSSFQWETEEEISAFSLL